jgi:hypothetical protein
LFGLEEIDFSLFKRGEDIRREDEEPQMVVDEAGERDVRGRFTLKQVAQLSRHPEQQVGQRRA